MMPQAGNRVIRHCRALRGLVVCYRRGARKASWRKWHFPGLESGWWNLVPGEGAEAGRRDPAQQHRPQSAPSREEPDRTPQDSKAFQQNGMWS